MVSGLILAVLTACSGRTGELDQPFTLAIGEEVRFASLGVTLDEVVEDSRCPADVQCIWEGRTAFAVSLTLDRRAVEGSGNLTLPGEPVVAQNYTVSLVSVEPPRGSAGVEIAQADYQATVVVRRAE